MTKKKIVKEEVIKLVPSGAMKLVASNGGTLELVLRDKEPAVLLDGRFLLRHTTLMQAFAANERLRDVLQRIKGEDDGESTDTA